MKETSKFLIRKHNTSHPHYDLFLEVGNELKSWIIPTNIPKNPSDKKVAIEVDVPKQSLEEAEAQEMIEDAFGVGKTKLWDKGIYTLETNKKIKIIINAEGGKLKGRFLLHVPNWGRWTKKRLWTMEKIK
jgi:bifunctional non-homologous end joining protein LigD